MKISTNFVPAWMTWTRPLIAALWGLVLLCAAVVAWLLHDAAGLRAELPRLDKRLAGVEAAAQAASLRPGAMPSAQELSETRRRVTAVNAVTRTRGMTTLALLAGLERKLPAQAWLVSLHHRAMEGEVMLVVAASSATPLSEFLLQLERDPEFSQALLLRETQGNGSDVQYEIRLKVRT
ncbi:MAG TPA: PilN domain-containing protein [Gallionellaceae bacterium]